MKLKRLLLILKRRIWLLIIIPLLASALFSGISIFIAGSHYESTVALIVSNKQAEGSISYEDILASRLLAKSYQELFSLGLNSGTYLNDLGFSGSRADLLIKNIMIKTSKNSNMIQITVRDGDKPMAMQLSRMMGEKLVLEVKRLNGTENIKMAGNIMTVKHYGPQELIRNTVLVFLAGILLAFGISLLLEMMDDTVKSAEDIKKHFGIPVLGIIPRASRLKGGTPNDKVCL